MCMKDLILPYIYATMHEISQSPMQLEICKKSPFALTLYKCEKNPTPLCN